MFCVTLITYSVLRNDQPQKEHREDCVKEIHLFLFCVLITLLLNSAEQAGFLSGIRFSEAGPCIHHLLFAPMLKGYGDAGQVINLSKSSITFEAWRVLQSPYCMFSRLIKRRYVDSGDFLSSDIFTTPSFAWRSILFGSQLLLKELKEMAGHRTMVLDALG